MGITDASNLSPEKRIAALENTVDELIKRLGWITSRLDSQNVKRLDTDETIIKSADGTTEIVGPVLVQKDSGGTTRLQQGYDAASGDFVYELYNALGIKTIGIDSNGDATFIGTITASAITGGTITGGAITGGTITGGTITGGIIRTADVDNDRLQLSDGKFAGYNSSNQVTGLYFDITTIPATGLADIYLYHNGTPLAVFHDEITAFAFRGVAGGGFRLGGTDCPTYAEGNWSFTGQIDVSLATVLGLSTNTVAAHTHDVTIGVDTYTTTSAGGHSHTVS